MTFLKAKKINLNIVSFKMILKIFFEKKVGVMIKMLLITLPLSLKRKNTSNFVKIKSMYHELKPIIPEH